LKNKPALFALILLLLFISSSIFLIFEYVATEKQRDLDAWQARLGIMAESQQNTIESWIAKQVDTINNLATNPLLQLYVSQSSSAEISNNETSRGQLHHLKNLINATADNADVFTPIKNIKSNEKNKVNDGMAVINENGVLLATRYFPGQEAAITKAYKQALKNQTIYISNIVDIGSKQPRFIIVAPVSSVQSLSSNDIRAVLVAVINPENNLYKLLLKDWVTTNSEETLLVSLDDNSINYLTPLKSGYEVFHKQALSATAEAVVAKNIGEFVTLPDYRRTNVLATARTIRNTAMVLVQKIDVDEALAESTVHQNFILTVFLLAVFIIAIGFIAIWRHSTSLHLQ
jgi:hypothetical protein